MDLKVFEEWVTKYSDIVYRVCYYMTRDREMSNDAMCQVFIECYKEMRKQPNPVYKSEKELGYMAIKIVRRMMKNKKIEQEENC